MVRSLESRVIFHVQEKIMEIDLTDLKLSDSAQVDALYDMLERGAAAEGGKWFFLINYLRCRIDPVAWIAFANRGKKFNLTYSLGSVRYNTEDEIGSEIELRANQEAFQANLAHNREAALEKLEKLRREYLRANPEPVVISPKALTGYRKRISFDARAEIMEADFSDFAFTDSTVVNTFYDVIENAIADTGRDKWWFLVNYAHCEVHPEAWVGFAHRGKRLNVAHSLGSVRYDASEETRAEIAMRSDAEKFDSNLFATREEALERIEGMKAGRA